jgi:hypothetical protein
MSRRDKNGRQKARGKQKPAAGRPGRAATAGPRPPLPLPAASPAAGVLPGVRAVAFVEGGPSPYPQPVVLPAFDRDAVLRMYLAHDHEGVTRVLLDVLDYCARNTFVVEDPSLQDYIDAVVETFLFLLTKPNYKIPNESAERLVCLQHVFANLVAVSRFRTTDPQLAIVQQQPGNFVKLLFLYSPYNESRIDPKLLFDGNATLASMWYAVFPLCTAGYASARVGERVREHAAYVDERLLPATHYMAGLYFGCTHIDPDSDRRLKGHWNAAIRRQIGGRAIIANRPLRDSVAVVTGRWTPASAVYKTGFPYIRALKERYRLTLVHLGKNADAVDTSLFDSVRRVFIDNASLDCHEIAETDFQMAYFPDVGMDVESIWLANMRLAPIQMAGYGHPATTGGSEIDYFLGGRDCEIPELAGRHYAERLVVIPGIGLLPAYPTYKPRFPEHARREVLVNLPWAVNKINYRLLTWVQAIQQRASKPVLLQFLPGPSLNRYNAVLPFLRDIGALFGDTANVHLLRPCDDFMAAMEQGDFALDSHPFGGFHTAVDSIFLGKPIVTIEGTRAYSRCSSALMRKIGMEELIARDEEEYIAKALRLVEDDGYRRSLSRRLRETDLRRALFDTDEPQYFRQAVDFLIENHEALRRDGSRAPIFIQ